MPEESPPDVACVGMGNVGRGWAILFASAGCRVTAFDSAPAAVVAARRHIEQCVEQLARYRMVADPDVLLDRIRHVDTLEAAVEGAQYVQESVAENESVKRAVFCELDAAIGPDTIAGSSTSEICGSRFLLGLGASERFMVVHPINPPYLIRAVELCPTSSTSEHSVKWVEQFLLRLRQVPILVRKEIKGFVANRLQVALLAEALHLIGEGYCSAADVDAVVKHGLGLRWSFMGPFETGHLNSDRGYLEYVRKFEPLMRDIAADLQPTYPWTFEHIAQIDAQCRQQTPPEVVAARQLWRDDMLMGIRRFLATREDR
jgi:3-hydroxyacyl-CoA dehydrogenase